ncbi:MAG TPA: DUF4149 domain-containing protein [Dissulfurispiraceae bacterium]|nr:DUF4149 domain-containing protein [Dissulfurispiraceae bacterium]
MSTLIHLIYTLLLALWVGGISLFTFIVTPDIFRAYSRDAAGEIVGKLFPSYFLFMLVLSVLVLFMLFPCRVILGQSGFRWSLVAAVIAVVINFFVFFKLHPEIRQIKQEIHSFQSLQTNSPSREKFRKLHAVSMTLNLILLADGAALLLIGTVIRDK